MSYVLRVQAVGKTTDQPIPDEQAQALRPLIEAIEADPGMRNMVLSMLRPQLEAAMRTQSGDDSITIDPNDLDLHLEIVEV